MTNLNDLLKKPNKPAAGSGSGSGSGVGSNESSKSSKNTVVWQQDDGDGESLNPYAYHDLNNRDEAHSLSHLTFSLNVGAGNPIPTSISSVSDELSKYLELDPSSDMPVDMNIEVWNWFVDRRKQHIAKELETKRAHSTLNDYQRYLAHLHHLLSILSDDIRGLHSTLLELHSSSLSSNLNTEILLRIQQGQVEIEEAPVVTDLKHCEMIDRSIVEKLNSVIQKIGSEKVEILKETTVSNTAMNLLKWNQQKLNLEHADSLDLTTELQLLRVTKSLQSLIKMGGHDNQKAAELKILDRKLEFVNSTTTDNTEGKKLHRIRLPLFPLSLHHRYLSIQFSTSLVKRLK